MLIISLRVQKLEALQVNVANEQLAVNGLVRKTCFVMQHLVLADHTNAYKQVNWQIRGKVQSW